jgi:hypothetical protein
LLSFHLTVARGANSHHLLVLSTDVANGTKGYAESGYVGWIHKEIPVRNTF